MERLFRIYLLERIRERWFWIEEIVNWNAEGMLGLLNK